MAQGARGHQAASHRWQLRQNTKQGAKGINAEAIYSCGGMRHRTEGSQARATVTRRPQEPAASPTSRRGPGQPGQEWGKGHIAWALGWQEASDAQTARPPPASGVGISTCLTLLTAPLKWLVPNCDRIIEALLGVEEHGPKTTAGRGKGWWGRTPPQLYFRTKAAHTGSSLHSLVSETKVKTKNVENK